MARSAALKICAALGAALLLVAGGTTAAFADQLAIGDAVTPLSANSTVSVQACNDQATTFTVLIAALRQSGSDNQTFKNGAAVTVTAGAGTAGLTAVMGADKTIDVPGNWQSVDSSPPQAGTDVISAVVTLPATTAAGSGTVAFGFSGTNVNNGTRSGSTSVTVTWGAPKKCILDSTAPVLSLPGGLTAEATSAAGAAVTYSATATDETAPAQPSVTCDRPTGSVFPLGTTTVTCSATDAAGNTRTGEFALLVRDTTKPVVGAISDIGFEAAHELTTVTWTDPTATDAVAGSPAVTCTPASGAGFPVGDTTVTCSATDGSGNTGTSTFIVHISDTTDPSIVLPANLTVEATSPAGGVAEWEVTADDDADPEVDIVCDPASGSVFALGTKTVRCTATDDSGNASGGSFTVSVVDTVDPEISATDPAAVEATGPEGAVVEFVTSATDAVDEDVAIDCTRASGSTFPVGTTIVTCTATDDAGNTDTTTVNVRVMDTTPPVVDVPDTIEKEATGPDGASVEFTATATDIVDQSLDVVCTPTSGATFAIGSAQVNCSTTDDSGNTGSAAFAVIVKDTTAPVLDLPADVTEEADGPGGTDVSYAAAAEDLVDGDRNVTCSLPSGSTFPLGKTTVSCSASDVRGNTAYGSFVVEIVDTTAPVLTLPGPITEEAVAPAGNVVTFTATATDLVDGDRAVTCDADSGDTFPVATTTVECSSTDTRGNTAHGSFTVKITDTTPPALTLPAPITEEAEAPEGNVVSFTATASDIVDGDVPVTCTPPSGSTFGVGLTSVVCSAKDSRGNSDGGSFSVNITDTTAPVLHLPAPIEAEATGPAGAPVTYTATATDLVDGPRAVSCLPSSGSTFGLGSTSVACHAEDTRGNMANGAFTVKVVDTTAPVLTLPGTITEEATGASGAVVTFTPTAIDLVDGARTVSCAPESGSTFGLGSTTVTCTAADSRGNTASGSFAVKVVDTTKPELTLPSTITAEATSAAGAPVSYVTSASDIVDGSVAVSCAPASGSTFTLGATTVACEAKDAAGNKATGSFTVKVVDTTAPVITWTGGPADNGVYVFGSVPAVGSCTATDLVDGTVACAITGYGSTVGGHTAKATATDGAGNTAEVKRTYSVTAWKLSGFYQPVDMGGTLNTVKGGATVPLKFEVFAGATELVGTSAVKTFTQKEVSCSTGATVLDEIEVTTTGGTTLRYDATAGQFIQNWQTPKKPGACFVVTMTTQDGTAITANFKLK